MVDVASTQNPPVAGTTEAPANGYKPTFEDQILAYSCIYGMAILCVIWGSIRSLQYVRKIVSKNKKIETSIHMSDAKKFPITASLFLFGLYIIFKGNAAQEGANFLRTNLLPKLPDAYHPYFHTVADFIHKENSTREFNVRRYVGSLHPVVEEYVSKLPEFSKQNVVTVLLYLMTIEGVCCLATLFTPLISFVLNLLPIGNHWPRRNVSYYFVFKYGNREMDEGEIETAKKDDVNKVAEIEFDDHWFLTLLFCIPVGVYHIVYRHWITNNLIAMAFSIIGIESLHLSSFRAGFWMLIGLFFYDIFWVFGTDVMTTVAKSIEAPILLMFPQDLMVNGWLNAKKHGMLGLGDIVIPGIFIALIRRFDHYVASSKGSKHDEQKKEDHGKDSKKEDKKGQKAVEQKSRYYFLATILAYAIGLVTTIAIMHYFNAAQPALLYLVPLCLLVPMFFSLCRSEFGALWGYSEESFSDRHVSEQKKKNKKNN